MRLRPKLKVGQPIVGLLPVDVMNLLGRQERAPESTRNNEPVLGHVSLARCHWTPDFIVLIDEDQDVSLLRRAPTPPVRMAAAPKVAALRAIPSTARGDRNKRRFRT
jgi:hypothetical protein